MGRLDEQKEYIGALKVYLGFMLAVILAVGGGTSRLYLAQDVGLLFYLGVLTLLTTFLVFAIVAKHMHKKISELKDL